MRYLIIDKKQRIEIAGDATYGNTRLEEELKAIGAEFVFATTDDIEIEQSDTMSIKVLGEEITNFTHIILRGHRLHKGWEYETKVIIADFIYNYNNSNPDKQIKMQNLKAIRSLPYYDKLYIQKVCIENELPVIPTLYRSSGEYRETFQGKYIVKDFTGENFLKNIDGKDKVKKNVFLIEKPEDLEQEDLIGKDLSKFISQEFIDIGEDVRVYVSNHIAFAAVTRKATEGFITVNKGEYSLLDLDANPEIKDMAEKVSRVFKTHFVAADFMRDRNGKLLFQELSFNPGFKVIEAKIEGSNVNIAKAIIQSF